MLSHFLKNGWFHAYHFTSKNGPSLKWLAQTPCIIFWEITLHEYVAFIYNSVFVYLRVGITELIESPLEEAYIRDVHRSLNMVSIKRHIIRLGNMESDKKLHD